MWSKLKSFFVNETIVGEAFPSLVEEKPYEFITNPPAKANAELVRSLKVMEAEEKRKQAKIDYRNSILASIDRFEVIIDEKIRNNINDGLFELDFKSEQSLHKSLKGYGDFLALILAAKRFRSRGFKVVIKTIKSPYYRVFHQSYFHTELEGYTKVLTISWKE